MYNRSEVIGDTSNLTVIQFGVTTYQVDGVLCCVDNDRSRRITSKHMTRLMNTTERR